MAARKVLIPIDGSEFSENMFKWYVKNLHRGDEEVIFFHVGEQPSLSLISKDGATNLPYEEWQKTMVERNKAIEDLEYNFTTEARNAKIQHFQFRKTMGKPGEHIVKAASDLHVDHIVIGSRGLGKIRRTFLGSVSDYVLHHSDIPVTIVTAQK